PSILIVDDDPDVRDIVAFKLGRLGYEVIAASDGATGLDAWTQLRPDLVLVDWIMPKVSGVELCRQIRDGAPRANTPLILLSARTRESDIRVGLDAGADDYIVKPFSPNELAARVEAVLAGKHTRSSTCA
ncbi:MAG TPA: response regulator, partial [Thermoleophilia bacterium]|nr:response regulator [Thermoleophilia bacterium]